MNIGTILIATLGKTLFPCTNITNVPSDNTNCLTPILGTLVLTIG